MLGLSPRLGRAKCVCACVCVRVCVRVCARAQRIVRWCHLGVLSDNKKTIDDGSHVIKFKAGYRVVARVALLSLATK